MKCRIVLDIPENKINNLLLHRDRILKRQVIAFVDSVIAEGFNHFVLSVRDPLSVWFANYLYYRWLSLGLPQYSLCFMMSDSSSYAWVDELLNEYILRNANQVLFINPWWHDDVNPIRKLSIN
ncbi:hypothetical protein LJC07_07480 [Christensenellaceae bacterium OttesenSCG-928-L17]|nr:hypothetical protein [Christensenellaceae bacterium OttesenSCG-928-L17]